MENYNTNNNKIHLIFCQKNLNTKEEEKRMKCKYTKQRQLNEQ